MISHVITLTAQVIVNSLSNTTVSSDLACVYHTGITLSKLGWEKNQGI